MVKKLKKENKIATATSPVPATAKPLEHRALVDFYEALRQIFAGRKATRIDWHDADLYGYLDGDRLRIHLADGIHDWIVTQGDAVAEDWIIL